ncbi:hypothetical protein B0H14DRAFT_3434665 [Mycena olivaceomarginata]|nr:hypothetical protein B0H14DRAFT_3434665 [Mycena olivaceomarginata]
MAGKKIVFKQILDRTDAPRLSIEAEILISLRPSPFFPNIEAFVIDEQGMMRGFLLPFLGNTIDSESVETLPLPLFRDLFLAMSDLERICKRPHGDLFARNILVSEDGKLTIIDVGNAGCDYPGDRQALADLLVDADILKKIPSDAERKAVAWAWDKLQENWAYPSIAQGLLPDDAPPALDYSDMNLLDIIEDDVFFFGSEAERKAREMRTQQRELVPIARLPPEIWPSSSRSIWLSVTRVSSLWRNRALACPDFRSTLV